MALDFQKINELITQNRISDAINLLSSEVSDNPGNDEAWFWRGKLYWRLGERRLAVNDYTRATELNPDSPAARALELAGDIENFFNPDIFNP